MTRSGVGLAAEVARGALTAEAAAEMALAAADADSANAFTSLDLHAPEQAANVDAAIAEGASAGLLAGVPIAVKDIIDHLGRTTTAGSAFYRSEAGTTAPALDRLEAEGAVVVGRTGLHEFAFGFSSENPWFGPVHNPWDPELSPGGSSGGSAAAVAAGIVPLALGTDTGGSVRVPAALCAIAGLKVTHGLIPLEGVFPLVPSLDTVGALAATLDDLAVATGIMAGARLAGDGHVSRLVVPRSWVAGADPVQGIGHAFEEFLAAAASAGFTVEEEELPALGPSPMQTTLIGPEVAAIHARWREDGLPYGDDVAARVDAAMSVEADALEEAQRWRTDLAAAMTSATADGAVLVTPTVAAMDKRIGEDMIGSRHYRTLLSWFTAPVNAAGCPALTMPLAGAGRRPSVQLIGPHWGEGTLLKVARTLEERGVLGVNPPPQIWSSE
ncbi:MAG TPA: amidase [Acidimicrobiia bacterium]|nr:amidase [Acidimicrobiia bacterium]